MCYYVVGYLVVWHNIWHGGMLCGHVGNSEELMTISHLLLSPAPNKHILKGSRKTWFFSTLQKCSHELKMLFDKIRYIFNTNVTT